MAITELIELDIEEISLVDKAANKRTFVCLKQEKEAEPEPESTIELYEKAVDDQETEKAKAKPKVKPEDEPEKEETKPVPEPEKKIDTPPKKTIGPAVKSEVCNDAELKEQAVNIVQLANAIRKNNSSTREDLALAIKSLDSLLSVIETNKET